MNVQKLRALLAAVRCGSINKAAEMVGYTESGLTYAINSFENELGLQLIQRSKTGIRLSPDGEELLPFLEKLVESDTEAMKRIEEITHRRKNTLRISLYSGLSNSCLFEVLAAFSARMPEIEISLLNGNIQQTLERLKAGEVDVGLHFDDVAAASAGIKCAPLYESPILVILPENRAAEAKKPFPVFRFQSENVVVFDGDESNLVDYGMFPAGIIKTGGLGCGSLFSIVEHGIAIAALPEVALSGCKHRVCLTPIEPPITLTLCALYRVADERKAVMREFLKCFREWANAQRMSRESF